MSRLFVRGRLVLLSALIGFLGLSAENAYATVITSGCGTDGSCSLEEMVNGGTITIDDKRFDNWGITDTSTVPVNIAGISIVPLDDQPLNPGLQFLAGGNLSIANIDEIFLQVDYTVSTTDGIARIKDSTLELGAFSFGQGLISVSEDLLDASLTNIIGHNEVTAAAIGEQLFDQTNFAPQSRLSIQTFIIMGGGAEGDSVLLDSFTQRFSQVPVPEPGSFLLLILGLVGLRYGHRRFQPVRSHLGVEQQLNGKLD